MDAPRLPLLPCNLTTYVDYLRPLSQAASPDACISVGQRRCDQEFKAGRTPGEHKAIISVWPDVASHSLIKMESSTPLRLTLILSTKRSLMQSPNFAPLVP